MTEADKPDQPEAQSEPEQAPEKMTMYRAVGMTFWYVFFGIMVVGTLTLAVFDFSPDLSHLDVNVLSGNEQGHYYHVGEQMKARASKRSGRVNNISTQGSVENVDRLVQHEKAPRVQFALVQDGLEYSEEEKENLRLVARLTSSETVFFLGRDADALMHFSQLDGKKIGIGPEGSGTARLARQIFASHGFSQLDVDLQPHKLSDQLDLVADGKLDLAIFVMEPNAPLIMEAVRERKLQIAGFQQVPAVAEHVPALQAGKIVVGHYDPIGPLPPVDKQVLVVDTLVLSDERASRSEIVSLLTLLKETFPGFVRHNRELPNETGLTQAPESAVFFDSGGPEVMDEYAPWLMDVVPLSNLITIVMAISVIFNLMSIVNRFFLWRIDVARVNLEAQVAQYFGVLTTMDEVEHLEPRDEHRTSERRDVLKTVLTDFADLKLRCRTLSTTVLVPMGAELAYRYQESLINRRLSVLRGYMDRMAAEDDEAASKPRPSSGRYDEL